MRRQSRRRLLASCIASFCGLAHPGFLRAADIICPPSIVMEACPPVHCPPIESSPYHSAPIGRSNDGQSASPTPIAGGQTPVDEAVPTPMPISPSDVDMNMDVPEFDLSSGLATNFGARGASSLAFADAGNVTPGYIDSAVIQTRVRVRYDEMRGMNEPTRAGFLYPQPSVTGRDGGGGRGPDYINIPNGELNTEELSTYIELAFRERLSAFIDVPVRWLEFEGDLEFPGNDNPTFEQSGLSDLKVGVRWGWLASQDEHLTIQVRASAPTGDAKLALGNGNSSIDVGLLYDRRLSDRAILFSEINDWQTLDAVTLLSDDPELASLLNQDANVLRGGIGLGFDLVQLGTRSKPVNLTLLTECVGWTVLDGVSVPRMLSGPSLIDATGDTIVNGKYGLRLSLKDHSFYAGYGHNWTSDRWYSDLLRLEWQRTF